MRTYAYEKSASLQTSHARLAMRAARRIASARRRSQKEKIGHTVCRHLLCLLGEGEGVPPGRPALHVPQTPNARQTPQEQVQISLGV